MLKKFAPFALAAVMVGTLAGCPEPEEREIGGGAGVGDERVGGADRVVDPRGVDSPAEEAAEQEALDWGTNLLGDKRNLAEAVARTGWLQANLAAGEWEQAGEDLADIEDMVNDLEQSEDVPVAVRQQLADFDSAIDELGLQLARRDRTAVQTADTLANNFSTLMTRDIVIAWMNEGRPLGGGAGAADFEENEGVLEDEGVVE